MLTNIIRGKGKMRAFRNALLITIAVIIWLLSHAFYGTSKAYGKANTEKAGDFLAVGLPALAGLSTFFAGGPEGSRWDREGTFQVMKSIGFTSLTTHTLKVAMGKMRPNESAANSFPSGHTSAAFSGAAFMNTRYGWKWGIPFYAAAVFTGYSRVDAEAHYLDDVTAGAAIAQLWNWYLVTRKTSGFVLYPMAVDDGVGLMLTYAHAGVSSDSENKQKTTPIRFRFNFGFGPAFLVTNEIKAPSSTGTLFDLDRFENREDPTTTAAVSFEHFLRERHTLRFFFAPFESRDYGLFNTPVSFGGQIFPANTTIRSAYRMYELRGFWNYNLTPYSAWDIQLGAGLLFQNLEVELLSSNGVYSEAKDNTILPIASGTLGYRLTPKLSVSLDIDGTYLPSDYMVDAVIALKYQINRQWDFSLGYEYYNREIDTDALVNKVIYNIPYIAVAHSW